MSAYEKSFALLTPDELRDLKYTGHKRSVSGGTDNLRPAITFVRNLINIAALFVASVLSFRMFMPDMANMLPFILAMLVVFIILVACDILPGIAAGRQHVQVFRKLDGPLGFTLKIFHPLTILLFPSKSLPDTQNDRQDSAELMEKDTIIKGIANFGNTSVSAIMCPRIDVTAVDIKWGFDKIIPVIINSGFSRIPVYSGSFDSVRGILYAKDVLPYSNYPASFKWQALLRPPYFVPETKKINELLKDFQLRKIHMAVVIDEYGGTSGIVTLEDILEEIVGEITDENDEEITLYRRIDETRFIFEGKILLHDFCKVLGTDEDSFSRVRGESETLAGLMLELAGEIPQKDQIIKYDNFTFKIESVDSRRIKEILVEIEKKDEKPVEA